MARVQVFRKGEKESDKDFGERVIQMMKGSDNEESDADAEFDDYT